MRRRMEAAGPSPLINAARNTSAGPDRANVHVAAADQPRLVMGIWIAAAGESGHGPHDSADRAGREAARAGVPEAIGQP